MEYAVRGEINCPDKSQIKDFERERSRMETYVKSQFRQKYTNSDKLPSPTIVDDRFATTGLPGGTREKLFTIGRTAMQVLRARKLVIDQAKTWNIYNRYNFDQEQNKITPPMIPSGNHNIYPMKKLEAFAQCINPNLEMKMTEENLASTQNRLYLELATPAQTIIKKAVARDSLFVLMASVTQVETGVLASNFKSGRLRQTELYQNFLLTRSLAERDFEPGDEFTGKIDNFLEEQETIWPNFIKRNLDGLNQLAHDGNSKELDSRLRNLESFPPTILNQAKETYSKIPPVDDTIAAVIANQPEGSEISGSAGVVAAKTYQQVKETPGLGDRLHPGYSIKSRQSEQCLLNYTTSLASHSVSEQQTLIYLNNYINLYRNAQPKVLEAAISVVRSVNLELVNHKQVVLPQGSSQTLEKGYQLMIQARIANFIKHG
jgi:hypothetical protein